MNSSPADIAAAANPLRQSANKGREFKPIRSEPSINPGVKQIVQEFTEKKKVWTVFDRWRKGLMQIYQFAPAWVATLVLCDVRGDKSHMFDFVGGRLQRVYCEDKQDATLSLVLGLILKNCFWLFFELSKTVSFVRVSCCSVFTKLRSQTWFMFQFVFMINKTL